MKFNDHFVAWILIYALGAFISIQTLSYFNLSNSLIGLFFAGLIITLFSWMMFSLLYHNKFSLNKWFFIWCVTHAFNFWWIDLILKKIGLTYQGFLYFFLFGLIYHLVTWMIKHKIFYKIKMSGAKSIIIIVFAVIIIFFISAQPFSQISKVGLIEDTSVGSSLSSIRDSLVLDSFQIVNSCPRLDVLLRQDGELGYYVSNSNDIDVKQAGWRISVYNTAEMFGIKTDYVFCHIGSIEGQNPDYFYCDSGGLAGGIPYISKTIMNPDGTIGKTIKKSFVNIYSKKGDFVKTICGEDPESIAKDNFKKTMRDLDNLFSLN